MSIAAHFEDTPASQPRAPRRTLRLEAHGALPSGDAARVLVHNVSAGGLLIESPVALNAGERLIVDLPEAGPVEAETVWASGALYGCRFDTPLSPAALSAAQLRAAAGPGIDLAPPADGEGFARRLHRLRRERGLSLSQLATALGVSKPTVWAWEQGKSRPLPDRIEALAKALEVPPEDLATGRDTGGLANLVARSREDIARAYGANPERVRILIEL